MSEPSTELAPRAVQLVHPVTGELIDLSTEDLEALAELVADLQEHRGRLADFDQAVNEQIVAHLDRSARWTQRVGDPMGARQFEIKAPSPEAGSAVYPVDALVPALRRLVDAGVITEEAASNACVRRLALELAVPWDANLAELAEAAANVIGVQIAGVAVDVLAAAPSQKPSAAGIKALRKIPGAVGELDRVKITPEQPPRRATVKVKVRG